MVVGNRVEGCRDLAGVGRSGRAPGIQVVGRNHCEEGWKVEGGTTYMRGVLVSFPPGWGGDSHKVSYFTSK